MRASTVDIDVSCARTSAHRSAIPISAAAAPHTAPNYNQIRMEKVIVTAKFHTGHRQLGYPGKCKFVHGHTWQGRVVVAAEQFPRDHLDMSIEFGDIKNVMRFMDHKMLVTEQDQTFLDQGLFEPEGVVMLKGNGPSVENVAAYVFDGVVDVIRKQYPGRGVRYTIEVTIQETENNIFVIEKTCTV